MIEEDHCNRETATAVPPLDLVVGDHTVLVVAGAVGDIIVERGIVTAAEVIVVLTGGTNVVRIDTAQGTDPLHQEDRVLVLVLQPTIENLTMIGLVQIRLLDPSIKIHRVNKTPLFNQTFKNNLHLQYASDIIVLS